MSGVVFYSVGAAFWGLVAGSAVYLLLAPRRPRTRTGESGKENAVIT
jgi:benzoate membrane transport protein